jgi:hypothetical protein
LDEELDERECMRTEEHDGLSKLEEMRYSSTATIA